MRILVAADDTATRRVLERCLTQWGYDVIATPDGAEALAKLSGPEPPSMAILDWMPRGARGPDICRQLQRLEGRERTYLILLVAGAESRDIGEGLEAGADDILAKPLDEDLMRVRLEVGRRVATLKNTLVQEMRHREVVEMAGTICHELNQPMQVVLGLCQLLTMDLDEENPLYENIVSIADQIDKMGTITKRLMMSIVNHETRNYLNRNAARAQSAAVGVKAAARQLPPPALH